jgi:hypothetical protein
MYGLAWPEHIEPGLVLSWLDSCISMADGPDAVEREDRITRTLPIDNAVADVLMAPLP